MKGGTGSVIKIKSENVKILNKMSMRTLIEEFGALLEVIVKIIHSF
jgi:hypothetical protein